MASESLSPLNGDDTDMSSNSSPGYQSTRVAANPCSGKSKNTKRKKESQEGKDNLAFPFQPTARPRASSKNLRTAMASQNLSPPVNDETYFSSDSSPVHEATKVAANPRKGSGKSNNRKKKRACQQDASSSCDDVDHLLLTGLVEFFHSHRNSLDMMDFVKQRLGGGFTNSEIEAKIGQMKKKYFEMKEKEENVYESPHEARVFELSKRVWDDASNPENEENGADDEETVEDEYVFLKDSLEIPKMLGVSDALAESMITMLGRAEAKELNRCWKELRVEAIHIYMKKLELLREMGLKILDAIQKK